MAAGLGVRVVSDSLVRKMVSWGRQFWVDGFGIHGQAGRGGGVRHDGMFVQVWYRAGESIDVSLYSHLHLISNHYRSCGTRMFKI